MSSSDPERDGGPDAEQPPSGTDGRVPLDIDTAFAAIVAGWADDNTGDWPAEEDLSSGRHRRSDDPADSPGPAGPGSSADSADPGGADEGLDGDNAVVYTGAPIGALLPSLGIPELDDPDIGGFVPPIPPPIPRGDLISRLAWAGVMGGPTFLLAAVIAWRTAPQILVLAAVGAFVGGFVVLVSRMPKHRADDDDDGAVV